MTFAEGRTYPGSQISAREFMSSGADLRYRRCQMPGQPVAKQAADCKNQSYVKKLMYQGRQYHWRWNLCHRHVTGATAGRDRQGQQRRWMVMAGFRSMLQSIFGDPASVGRRGATCHLIKPLIE